MRKNSILLSLSVEFSSVVVLARVSRVAHPSEGGGAARRIFVHDFPYFPCCCSLFGPSSKMSLMVYFPTVAVFHCVSSSVPHSLHLVFWNMLLKLRLTFSILVLALNIRLALILFNKVLQLFSSPASLWVSFIFHV